MQASLVQQWTVLNMRAKPRNTELESINRNPSKAGKETDC